MTEGNDNGFHVRLYLHPPIHNGVSASKHLHPNVMTCGYANGFLVFSEWISFIRKLDGSVLTKCGATGT